MNTETGSSSVTFKFVAPTPDDWEKYMEEQGFHPSSSEEIEKYAKFHKKDSWWSTFINFLRHFFDR